MSYPEFVAFTNVYEGIIKTALRCALVGGREHQGRADPTLVDALVGGLDVNLLHVTYHFLFGGTPSTPPAACSRAWL
ncbi:hypothetical protein EON64_03395 [archaeon]|nr:MAG: hypothetical protein EON64_03395 [archaeon]